jgi:hypothetical protein
MVSHFTKVLAICHEFFIFMIYPGNWATTQTNDYSVNRYNTTKRESPINSTLNSSLRTDDIPGARPRNLNFSPPRLTNKQFLNIDRPGQRANERRLRSNITYQCISGLSPNVKKTFRDKEAMMNPISHLQRSFVGLN